MVRVLVAPDKFKGTLSASEVAKAISEGIREALPSAICLERPMADGGDGTLDVLLEQGWHPKYVHAADAAGKVVPTLVAQRGDALCVELARVCGIAALGSNLIPWDASTKGVGNAIRAAVDPPITRVVVALGGSASTDGGLGLLQGLGFRVRDARGRDVPLGLRGLESAVSIEAPDDYDHLRKLDWSVLSDVTAPLHGETGAAYVFGPQKGLTGRDVPRADAALRRWGVFFGTGWVETSLRSPDPVQPVALPLRS